MKRVTAVILALIMSASLIGCSDSIPTAEPTSEASVMTPPAETVAEPAPSPTPSPTPEPGVPAVTRIGNVQFMGLPLNRGDSVEVVDAQGGYYLALYNGIQLQIEKRFVRLSSEAPFESWDGYSRRGTKVYPDFDLDGDALLKLDKNTIVRILDRIDDRYLIEVNGQQGYVSTKNISDSEYSEHAKSEGIPAPAKPKPDDNGSSSDSDSSYSGGGDSGGYSGGSSGGGDSGSSDGGDSGSSGGGDSSSSGGGDSGSSGGGDSGSSGGGDSGPQDGESISLSARITRRMPRAINLTLGTGSPYGAVHTAKRETDGNAEEFIPQTGTVLKDGTSTCLPPLERGTAVRVISEEEGMSRIIADGQEGFVESASLRLDSEEPFEQWVGFSERRARLYSDPNDPNSDHRQLELNRRIKILDKYDDYYVVEVDGEIGYIAIKNVSDTEIEERRHDSGSNGGSSSDKPSVLPTASGGSDDSYSGSSGGSSGGDSGGSFGGDSGGSSGGDSGGSSGGDSGGSDGGDGGSWTEPVL